MGIHYFHQGGNSKPLFKKNEVLFCKMTVQHQVCIINTKSRRNSIFKLTDLVGIVGLGSN